MMKRNQSGVYIIEFALVSILFFTVLLGIMDFGRFVFMWNAAAEATRVGARVSVVCNFGANRVLTEMKKFAPVTSSSVQIVWYDSSGNPSPYDSSGTPTNCSYSNCTGVSVSINGLSISPFSPVSFIGFSSLQIPPFSTYLSREIMGQDPDSGTVCN